MCIRDSSNSKGQKRIYAFSGVRSGRYYDNKQQIPENQSCQRPPQRKQSDQYSKRYCNSLSPMSFLKQRMSMSEYRRSHYQRKHPGIYSQIFCTQRNRDRSLSQICQKNQYPTKSASTGKCIKRSRISILRLCLNIHSPKDHGNQPSKQNAS